MVRTVCYVTGSRRADLFLLGVLLAGLLAACPALAVYHRLLVAEITLTRVDPDGTRRAVPTPPEFSGRRRSFGTPADLEERVRRHVRSTYPLPDAPQGARFEWRIRYAQNSSELEHELILRFDRRGGELPAPSDAEGRSRR